MSSLLKIGCAGTRLAELDRRLLSRRAGLLSDGLRRLLRRLGRGTIVPAHGGDAVRVVIVKRRLPGSTYTTIATTLLVRAPFDTLMALALFILLFMEGVLPGHKLLPHLPAFDFSWFFGHPRAAIIIVGTIVLLLTAATLWAWRSIIDFRERVRQGLRGLLDWRFYLRRILPWQLADWGLRLVMIFFALLAFHMPATFHNSLLAQGTSNPLRPAADQPLGDRYRAGAPGLGAARRRPGQPDRGLQRRHDA